MKPTTYLIFFISILGTSCQQIPLIEKFSGNRGVLMGKESSLSWEVKNADKLLIKNNNTGEEQQLQGEQGKFKFTPLKDFSFTLVAQNKKGSVEKVFQGKTLPNPPVIDYFRGSEEYEVGSPQLAFLEWNIRNAQYIYLRKLAENLPPVFRSDSIAPDTTTLYELVAVGEFGDTVSKTHLIKVLKPEYSIGVSDSFKTPAAIIGKENTVKWDFKGAESVRREFGPGTLAPSGTYTIKPSMNKDGYYTERFFVKYPAYDEEKVFTFKAPLESYKAFFKPSKLKAEPKENITLNWDVLGTKEYEVFVDDESVALGIEGKGTYSFPIKKTCQVRLQVIDMQDDFYETVWTIKCGSFRPFIVNALDYQTIKNEYKKRRFISEIYQIDRSKYPEEIKLRVLVTDTLGNFIRGLAPPSISNQESRKFFKEIIERTGTHYQKIKDFKILEINQQISQPYDVAFCLDYSGSMALHIQSLENAVRKMVNKKDEEDRFSIVRFDEHLKTEIRLENDINAILEEVPWKGLDGFGGSTALYAGTDEALHALDLDSNSRQKIMFLFTDGHENSSFLHSESGRLFRAVDLIKKAREKGVKIYPIGFGSATNEKLLDLMGWMTDGFTFQIDDSQSLESAYSEIPRLFRNYYEITYKPIVDKDPKGEKGITLEYFNNQRTATTITKYQTNNSFAIDEETGSNVPIGSLKNKKQIVVPPQVVAFFNFDKYDLRLEFLPNLEAIYKFLVHNPSLKIDIIGHTDLVGTVEKNVNLSRLRAESIQQYLLQKGISQNRMFIVAMGKSKPVWKVEEEPWQAQENRRIEIMVWE
ncbi:MAG: OmpA family protein [Microscillaceae bacterium]|nr:OmpA family protein [Microscillaceae bacterium]